MWEPSLLPEYFLRDIIVRTEPLIAASGGGFQTRPYSERATSGQDTGRFCSSSRLLTLNLHPSETDFSGFNQLSARLRNHTTGSLLVGMKLIHGSKSFNSETSDVSLSGGREELRAGEWFDLKFPAESFGTYGTPDGWRDIREIEVSFSRERTYEGTEPIDVEIQSLHGEFREIPPGPRLTLEGLAQVLNPDLPGVRGIAAKQAWICQVSPGGLVSRPPVRGRRFRASYPGPAPVSARILQTTSCAEELWGSRSAIRFPGTHVRRASWNGLTSCIVTIS